LAFVPPVVAYLALKPASFAQTVPYQLSTSQLIGLLSALTVAYFYTRFWEQARKSPRLAMGIGDPVAIRELQGESMDDTDDGASSNHDGEDEGDEEAAEKPA
jgi:phosphatidylglycerol:prolipoprotein diacylglycerol transferase